jgi:hypothetical protein
MTATIVMIPRAIESRNDSFMTDQGSSRVSTSRARRLRAAAGAAAAVEPEPGPVGVREALR